jgi:hypothetical protein
MKKSSVQSGSIVVTVEPGGNVELATSHAGGLLRGGNRVVVERADLPDLLQALLVVDSEPLRPAHECTESTFWRERWLEQNKLYAALAVRQAKLERLITSLEVLRSAATRYHGSRELEEQTRAKHQSAPSTAAWQLYTAASDHRRRCHQELEAAALQYAAATNHIDGRVV